MLSGTCSYAVVKDHMGSIEPSTGRTMSTSIYLTCWGASSPLQ